MNIPEIEPWPGTVDGASLLDEIATTVRRFIVSRDAVAEAVALWVVHTHALDAAVITPRLAITSPENEMPCRAFFSAYEGFLLRRLSRRSACCSRVAPA